MNKAPRLSPRALALTDRLLARLPTTVTMLEAWWEQQNGVRRVEMFMLLKHLDGERWDYDRAAKMVRPVGTKPAAVEPSPQVRAAVSTRAHRHAGTSTPIITEKMLKASTSKPLPPLPVIALPEINVDALSRVIGSANDATAEAPASVSSLRAEDFTVTVGAGKAPPLSQDGAVATSFNDESEIITVIVGGVGIHGPRGAAEMAGNAYLRTDPRPKHREPLASLVVDGLTFSGEHEDEVAAAAAAYIAALPKFFTTVGGPSARSLARVAKPRQSKPVTGSVSERVRLSVCRKPGTVGEVIARFPDVNENTIRGALGTLKSKGLVGHTGGKYGAPRG